MIRTVFAMLVAVHLAGAPDAGAQPRTAEVRTSDGQVFRVEDPAFRMFYTIAPPPKDGDALPGTEKRQGSEGRGIGVMASIESLKGLVDQKAAVSVQNHRALDVMTVYRGGVEMHVRVDQLASVTFTRQPIGSSTLPPYLRGSHVRHAAVIVLRDGTRLEPDYVNLGFVFLRGTTAQGGVDVPWYELETIRFTP